MDILKSIELLHENVLKEIKDSTLNFEEPSKGLYKIHLTFECQKCHSCIPSWKLFVDHLKKAHNVKNGKDVNCDATDYQNVVPNVLLNDVYENASELSDKSAFPLPPKKNKLARTEVNDVRRYTRLRQTKNRLHESVEDISETLQHENSGHVTNETYTTTQELTPVKRKRGRPPKNIHKNTKNTNTGNQESTEYSHDIQTTGVSNHVTKIRVTRQRKRLKDNQHDMESTPTSEDLTSSKIIKLPYANESIQGSKEDAKSVSANDNSMITGCSELSETHETCEKAADHANTEPMAAIKLKGKMKATPKNKKILLVAAQNTQKSSPEMTKSTEYNVVISNAHVENDNVLTSDNHDDRDEDSDKEVSLEDGDILPENLPQYQYNNMDKNDSAWCEILKIKEEEYAVMSRDQKEDLKARTCPFCYKTLPTLSDCLPHYKEHHDYAPKTWVKINPEEFKPIASNRAIKVPETCDQCQYCGKYFLKDKIERHVILVHVWRSVQRNSKRKKPSLCDICGQEFRYVHNLAVHRKSHLKNVEKRKRNTHYVCDLCGYSTPERKRLTLHTMSKHENKKAFKCTYANCSYETWERSSLRCHMYKHSDKKQFKCSYCSYECIQLKQLRNHLLKQHMVTLPKKYEVGVDPNGRKTVNIVAPRESSRKTRKGTKLTGEIQQLSKADNIDKIQTQETNTVLQHSTTHQDEESQLAVTNMTATQYASQDMTILHEQQNFAQEQEFHPETELVDTTKTQVIEQEYYHQEQVVTEENGTNYMLLYPSELGVNSYASVPQAVTEVLVTSNIGEQHVLHLYPEMSKSDSQSFSQQHPTDNVTQQAVAIETSTNDHVTMASNQSVAMETSMHDHNHHISMATTQTAVPVAIETTIHDTVIMATPPVAMETSINSQAQESETAVMAMTVANHGNRAQPIRPRMNENGQMSYVPVYNTSDIISACGQPIVENVTHIVENQNVVHETVYSNSVLQNENYVYQNHHNTNVIEKSQTYNVNTAVENSQIELTQVPIMYSEIQTPHQEIIDQEGQKSVEIISNSENHEHMSLEQDIARTLIQINDNHLS